MVFIEIRLDFSFKIIFERRKNMKFSHFITFCIGGYVGSKIMEQYLFRNPSKVLKDGDVYKLTNYNSDGEWRLIKRNEVFELQKEEYVTKHRFDDEDIKSVNIK